MSERTHRHVVADAATAPRPRRAAPEKERAAKKKPTKPRPHGHTELPPQPAEMSGRDYLIMLLHIGAEIEHALMVEYLYAAYSLGGSGVGARGDTVREWQDQFVTVAREEMGHLLTVQNALLLVGGPVSFERDDYPWSSPFCSFDFELEPLTLGSLAKYVYTEMPPPESLEREEDKETVAAVEKLVGSFARAPVGELYERIIELVSDPRVIPDSAFQAGSYAHQMNWDEWGRGYRPDSHKPYAKNPDVPPPHARRATVIVEKCATRTELVSTLREIASQGEAEHLRSNAKSEASHFDRFAHMFRAYQAILAEDPAFVPARRVPKNPVVAPDEAYAPRGAAAITCEESRAWASLFNVRYRMLLTLLTSACSGPRDMPALLTVRRAPLIARIFGEMYNLKAIANVLVRLPLGDPKKPERAGPPFQMPYTLVPPAPEANFWRLQRDLLATSGTMVDDLLDRAGRAGTHLPADGLHYLRALRETDAASAAWIDLVLAELTPGRRTKP
ncbi:MAG: ferritin-like domain-containing protein [Polyangiaceae bacterium]